MKTADLQSVVITGIGMVTPLGNSPGEVLSRIEDGNSTAAEPTGFDAALFACPVSARIGEFNLQRYVSETKLLRLMNRDAQLAVAAGRLALADAGVKPGVTHTPEEVALFGAAGMAGLPLREVIPLIRVSAGANGNFDLGRFGQAGLKAVNPILSFKILSNMPYCFVSINENIQGSNAIYAPWEGQGLQAVEAGIRALLEGDARCALVGGCDVKTHELAFASLQQQGLLASWARTGKGIIPGEGAAFLVLERKHEALDRGARIYGQVSAFSSRSHRSGTEIAQVRAETLNRLSPVGRLGCIVSSATDGDWSENQERQILEQANISADRTIFPKKKAGDLFAAAGLLQVGLGALAARQYAQRVLVNCFGHGSEQAALILDPL